MIDVQLQKLLEDSGAILNGHFLLTSGRHSNRYVEKFRVLEKPYALDKVCEEMALPFQNKNVQIVLGAAIGGILISGGVGRYLEVEHIFSERVNGKMKLRRGFHLPKGIRVLIVEDIITTGGSVFELINLVNEYDAEIVGVVNLVYRNTSRIDFGVPSKSLLNLPTESWEKQDCPLCKQNIPFTERGRTGK